MDKDPAEKLDYAVDWTSWLAASETISTSTWTTTPTGLTQSSPSINAGKVIVWLAGGTAGQVFTVTNHITTNQGREGERSFPVVIVDR